MIVETWEIYFADGTSTIIHVSEDDNLNDEIVSMCDDYGWDTDDIIEVHRIDVTEEPA